VSHSKQPGYAITIFHFIIEASTLEHGFDWAAWYLVAASQVNMLPDCQIDNQNGSI